MSHPSLTRFAWLSIAAALVTILLKTWAWHVTGSVGLLSDALESVVNLIGGIMALAMLTIAQRPADEDHAFGHGKAEYFSSGVEGSLILVAAASIGFASFERLMNPHPLEQPGLGLAVALLASVVIRLRGKTTGSTGTRRFRQTTRLRKTISGGPLEFLRLFSW